MKTFNISIGYRHALAFVLNPKRRKIFTLLFVALSTWSGSKFSQSVDWVFTVGNTPYSYNSIHFTESNVDHENALIVAGVGADTVDMDPGMDTHLLVATYN